ncbi:tyrosine decarboxylase MfnA [Methanoplanus limicola]|uniref:Probable L-tyrosine/L-aspartate decarboxylase n=1 Tax=Methanoplanus limicola DSM 2279 TaxID=937775 RepID=H1YYJ3_9EURY|nr:tyrosine decarboxylase MfnA [Methanoplanus limicola]EHQ35091.1 L-tyrosine decarboxylase [Methanoplanus limicola DSM 2279]
MQKKGCPEEEIFSFLSFARDKDRKYDKVLSSMCTIPHPVAVRAHNMFIESNLGDPGLFAGTAELESLLVREIGELMHIPDACGYATSGGTESNIQALRIAGKQARRKMPNVVVPESVHFSFEKACDILSYELRTVPCDGNQKIDTSVLEDYIDKNTVCITGIAGSTEYGVVDPIEHLSDICSDREIFLHIDAAFGGFVLPFLKNAPKFDFELDGVSSISVDPHKMGMSTIPCGCLIARDPSYFKSTEVETPYLTVQKECTLLGTRPGGPVAGALAVLRYLGRSGFEEIVGKCMNNNRRLIDGMADLGYEVAVQPDVNVASFKCENSPKGWIVSRTREGHMRTVCMPHITEDIIDEFLKDVSEINV